MTTYTIVPHGGDSTRFDIAIVGTNGTRQTMLGFETEADAEAWIEHANRYESIEHPDDDPFNAAGLDYFRSATQRYDH